MKTVKQCIAYAYQYCRPAELTGSPDYQIEPWTARIPWNEKQPWDRHVTTIKSTTRAGCTRIVNRSRYAVALWHWVEYWDNPAPVDVEEIKEMIVSEWQQAETDWAWDWQKTLRESINYLKSYEGYQDE